MAYALSHIFSLQRGSVGGITYFANQFHQICMRQRTAPVQPNTPFQSGIRSAFNAAEHRWESLSPLGRQNWADYAATCIYPGPAGPYSVPGRQLFIGTLGLALYIDGVFPDHLELANVVPAIAGWYNPGIIEAAAYTGATQGVGVDITFPAGRFAVAAVDCSIAFNLTRNRYKGPWQSSAKAISPVSQAVRVHVNIDRPEGTIGKAIFTRTRCFTAAPDGQPEASHSLAFPVFLRHICTVPIGNGNGESAARTTTAKKTAKKKKAKTA